MIETILTKVPVLGKSVDERFLDHRRRSLSLAGMASLLVAGCLFEYRWFFKHVVSWDLLAVIVAFAVVKLSTMAWYKIKD
jgi:hypothetical protein